MRRIQLAALFVIVSLGLLPVTGSVASTPAGSAFTYQGELTRQGATVTETCDFQVAVWDAASNGSQIGASQLITAEVIQGLFTLTLDFGAAAFDGSARWLALSVRCPAGAGEFTMLEPRQPITAAPYALSVPWSGLQGIPADIADGDQNTTYTAGPGLTLSGSTFQADTTALQRRVTGACLAGQYFQQIGADGSVRCASDAGMVFAPGSGLDLTEGVLAADASLARVADVPALAGEAGFITLTQADSLYQINAGNGLTRIGNSLSVVTETVQARVSGQCAVGSYVRAVNADGTVICGSDANSGGTVTGVTAGTGLLGGGAAGAVTLNADPVYLQRRVTGSCPAGEKILSIGADGLVTCAADADTRYTAGSGLALTGTTFSADGSLARLANITPIVTAAGFITQTWANATYQARVTGACSAGQKITAIAADGSVTCADDPTYSAGSGLSLSGNQFSVAASGITTTMVADSTIGAAQVVSTAVQLRVTGACAVGQYVRSVAADGIVTCGIDAGGTLTGITAGTGLTGGGVAGSPAISLTTAYQLPQGCAAGQVPVSNGAGGWTCQGLLPSGTIAFFGQAACPAGWTEVTALRGRAVVGLPASGTVNGTVGTALTNQGSRTATLSVANLPPHTHDVDPAAVSATSSSAGAHAHTVDPAPVAATTTSSGAHTHTLPTYGNIGDGSNVGGRDPSNPQNGTATTASAGAHTHSVTVDIPATTSDTQGVHTHSVTVDVLNTTSTSTGSGTAVDVTMPYLQLLACSKN